MKTKEGFCPRCGEWTEVSWDTDGCCGYGAESEGHIYYSSDFEEPKEEIEKPDSYYKAKAVQDSLDMIRGK